jgi:hypothetical protein
MLTLDQAMQRWSDQRPQAVTVSSFYGPGSWAAWCIIRITSWIPIIQNDYSHNFHFISYALYTNWAAVDALRQLKFEGTDISLASDFRQHIIFETIVDQAATMHAVLALGMSHALVNYAYCSISWSRARLPTRTLTALYGGASML